MLVKWQGQRWEPAIRTRRAGSPRLFCGGSYRGQLWHIIQERPHHVQVSLSQDL